MCGLPKGGWDVVGESPEQIRLEPKGLPTSSPHGESDQRHALETQSERSAAVKVTASYHHHSDKNGPQFTLAVPWS